MIETGNDDGVVGRAGEVSRFQIRPDVWSQYSQSSAYDNFRVASRVAQQHLRNLEVLFRTRAGREATDFDLYVLWNAGAGYYARIGFVAARVAPYKKVRLVEFVDAIPKTASGKILRRVLVERERARVAR